AMTGLPQLVRIAKSNWLLLSIITKAVRRLEAKDTLGGRIKKGSLPQVERVLPGIFWRPAVMAWVAITLPLTITVLLLVTSPTTALFLLFISAALRWKQLYILATLAVLLKFCCHSLIVKQPPRISALASLSRAQLTSIAR